MEPGVGSSLTVPGEARSRPPTIDQVFADVSDRVPGFAGLYRDEAGELVVLSTRPDLAPAAVRGQLRERQADFLSDRDRTAAGTPMRVVSAEHTFRELADWRNGLRSADWSVHRILSLDIDEVANRIRVGVEVEAALDGVGPLLAELELPEDAVLPAVVVSGTPEKKLSDRFRPIPGAVRITKSNNSSVCTLAVNTRSSIGDGFVTASHCSAAFGNGVDGTHFYQNTKDLTADWVGDEAADPDLMPSGQGVCPAGVTGCRMSDATLVKYNAGVWHEMGTIARTFGPESFDVDPDNPRWKISSIQGVVFGDSVTMVGQTSGWRDGVVLATCVDRTQSNGTNVHLLCQAQAGYGSMSGDSGAPVFKRNGLDDFVALVGLHWGIAPNADSTANLATFSMWNQVDFEISDAIGGTMNPLF